MIINNIDDFLNYIQGDKRGIIKVFKYITSINRNSMVKIDLTQINKENKFGDIYFVPNIGGDKNEEINMFNAVFIDLDAGRDKNKNYLPLDQVQEYKNDKIKEINRFELKPTFIIETRNGLHIYWILNDNPDLEKWKLCIDKLIIKFDSDKQVNNPARLMRMPFTYWMKDKDNPFAVKIIEFNNVKYKTDEILNILNDIETNNKNGASEKRGTYNKEIHICPPFLKNKNNVDLIKEYNTKDLRKVLNPDKIVFETQQEFYEYITQEINLSKFLGVGDKFNCIFHNDDNPSAGIFISRTNQYLYKCHSSYCGFVGNIIRCVEKIRNCNRVQAINFIKDIYLLEIKETEWQKEQKIILEENKRMIRSGELEESYPEIYKLVKKYDNLIYLLHDIAIDCVRDKDYTDSNDNVVFFASLKSLAKELNLQSHSKVPDRIGLFTFLGLINKLQECDIPKNDLKKSKDLAYSMKLKVLKDMKNKKAEDIFIPLINYFSIPSYCDKILEKSLERAILYKENNITMKGWSRELLQRTFGDEIANEIYPQFHKRKISKRSNIKTADIHKVVVELLNQKEYVLEKDIIEILNNKYSKHTTQIQIKRSLQEMLDTYELKRIRANNQIKKQFQVDSEGYPFIIVKK